MNDMLQNYLQKKLMIDDDCYFTKETNTHNMNLIVT